jgi:3-oxoacyl-[acyl-carrier-protein] synthase-1
MSTSGEAIVVTGIGMRCAVGNDVAQAAAAVRAGVSGVAEWRHMPSGASDGEGGLLAGAVEPDLGDVPWVEKAEELVTGPLYEALWQARIYDGQDFRAGRRAKIAAFMALPESDRTGVEERAYRELLIAVKTHCFAPGDADSVDTVSAGSGGGMVAMDRACETLRSGKAAAAILGGVESFLHGPVLASLHDRQRLKFGDVGTGMIPGEAAAFCVLELESAARKRGAQPLARLAAVALDREDGPLRPEEPIRGAALSRAIRGCLGAVQEGRDIHRVIVDLNGERWRFLEWSVAETRCLSTLPRGWRLWHPADCLGDVGAAFVPVACCLATRALDKGYGGPGGILLACSADDGQRGAAALLPATAKN